MAITQFCLIARHRYNHSKWKWNFRGSLCPSLLSFHLGANSVSVVFHEPHCCSENRILKTRANDSRRPFVCCERQRRRSCANSRYEFIAHSQQHLLAPIGVSFQSNRRPLTQLQTVVCAPTAGANCTLYVSHAVHNPSIGNDRLSGDFLLCKPPLWAASTQASAVGSDCNERSPCLMSYLLWLMCVYLEQDADWCLHSVANACTILVSMFKG